MNLYSSVLGSILAAELFRWMDGALIPCRLHVAMNIKRMEANESTSKSGHLTVEIRGSITLSENLLRYVHRIFYSWSRDLLRSSYTEPKGTIFL